VPLLVYETTDTDFANRAIDALREADIPCYRVGTTFGDASPVTQLQALGESQVCIYIERDSDFRQANDILLRLGAAVEEPLPAGRIVRIAVILIVAIATVIALMWSQ
jgi:hypothetical protein